MASDVHSKLTVLEALQIMGWTMADLAREADVNINVVRRAAMGSTIRINYTCAEAIADAFGCRLDDLEWQNGMTNIGRHAHTGRPIARQADAPDLCFEHHLVLSLTGVCGYCA